jgi:hypothetical protein
MTLKNYQKEKKQLFHSFHHFKYKVSEFDEINTGTGTNIKSCVCIPDNAVPRTQTGVGPYTQPAKKKHLGNTEIDFLSRRNK